MHTYRKNRERASENYCRTHSPSSSHRMGPCNWQAHTPKTCACIFAAGGGITYMHFARTCRMHARSSVSRSSMPTRASPVGYSAQPSPAESEPRLAKTCCCALMSHRSGHAATDGRAPPPSFSRTLLITTRSFFVTARRRAARRAAASSRRTWASACPR